MFKARTCLQLSLLLIHFWNIFFPSACHLLLLPSLFYVYFHQKTSTQYGGCFPKCWKDISNFRFQSDLNQRWSKMRLQSARWCDFVKQSLLDSVLGNLQSMQVNLFDLWKVLQTKTQLGQSNSRNPRISSQFKFIKAALLAHVQLADLQDGFIPDILPLYVEG